MIKAIIIEDEPNSLNNLKNQLATCCSDVEVIGEAASVQEGLEMIAPIESKIDVAFLDIDLPDGLVFQMLNELRPFDFEVIFTTAHDEHAIKACEYSSIGYILKPIDQERLDEAIKRIQINSSRKIEERLEAFENYFHNPNVFDKINIHAVDGIYFINVKDIIRLEGDDNYTHFFLKNGKRLTSSKTMKSFEDFLYRVNFYRVHRSHIINMNCINKFTKGEGGYIEMEDGKKIEVSRRRRPRFLERIRRLNGNSWDFI